VALVAVKPARFSWLPGGLAAALVIALGRLVSSTSNAPLELPVYDAALRATQDAPSPEIVIITIDEASVAKLGEWPWPRDVHASLLDRLTSYETKVVTFLVPVDTSQRTSEAERLRAALALLESSDLGDSDQARQLRSLLAESASGRDPNAHLAEAMKVNGSVVLPLDVRVGDTTAAADVPARLAVDGEPAALAEAQSGTIIQQPADVFVDTISAAGHTNVVTDSDGTLRMDLAALRVGNALVPSLATATAGRAFGLTPEEIIFSTNAIHFGERIRPLTGSLSTRPQYFQTEGAASFAQYPYWRVLAGEIPREQLQDKVVLIGFMNAPEAAASTSVTPVNRASPAVVTTASTVSSLLTGRTYSRPGYAIAIEWGVAVLTVVLAAFVLPAMGAGVGAVLVAITIIIFGVAEVGLLSSTHAWARLILPCVALTVAYGVHVIGSLIGRASTKGETAKDSIPNLRNLGQTFQRQGQLDLAFETYRRCPLDVPTMELLYYLGMDFERRRQLQKAADVYNYIATRDPNYRDLRARRARVKEEPLAREPVAAPPPVSQARRFAEEEPAEAPRSARGGRTLGRYELERELGRGAMGTVYLGRDPKINRVVAIKAIPLAEEFEEEDLAEARARFFREAEMAGRLNHPAIVTVYDAGEDQGLAYIAMEYLRGTHLSHFTDPARLLPSKTVMLLCARVAEALHYAHRQNVVHRDIKPANIMFNAQGDELKITDFGIARLTDTSRTKTGIVLGTPSFMSPEQLEGRTLDGRSDQFALGVSLYQLLCGQLPFRAESMPRLMQKIATEPHASVRLIRPELPECIDAIITRALAKSAEARYATCGELAAALRSCAGPQDAAQSAEPRHEWLIP
jgi:CHASE2 domain-containing sensor protein